jgi:protein-L-isoaspartate(D-aspartate) O-methyltransferase
VLVGDGSLGLAQRGPFEAIAVHAAAPGPPRALLGQLMVGGRLVVPLAAEEGDVLTVFHRREQDVVAEQISPCRFVPLVGEEGFAP